MVGCVLGSPKIASCKNPVPSPPPPGFDDMDRRSRLRAEAILAGTAEVEDGYIHSTTEGDSGKESTIHMVEALDEVNETLPASDMILNQDRYWLPPSVTPLFGRSAWLPSRPSAPPTTRCLPGVPTPVTSSSNTNPQFGLEAQRCGVVLWMGSR